ncbi:hypothetical protein OHV05_33725 [Kitasatospora sp. NBC_00070]|uniref:bestrophin-like domain n=1 Tax=Kitasatospora sp. NBC_00070 TaxID=2975962 RepID=UPI0032488F1A
MRAEIQEGHQRYMALSGLLTVIAGGAAAALLAWLSHRFLHRHNLPDTGPAVGTAAGAVFSFFVITIAFLLVNSTGSLVSARQNNYAEAGALVDLYLAAGRLPEPTKHQIRSHTEEYFRQVITEEWPQMARGSIDLDTWGTVYQLKNIVQDLPPDAPARAAGDANTAVAKLLGERRTRAASTHDEAPDFLLYTLVGAAVLSIVFLALLGWPRGRRGVIMIAIVGGMFSFGIWLVLQINHPYGSGVRVAPTAFVEAVQRIDLIKRDGY